MNIKTTALFSMLVKPAVGIAVLLLFALGGAFYFYTQYQTSQSEVKKLKENPQAAAQEESKKLIDKVGKLVALPENENPTIATVTDVEKLKEQPFFAKAKNGDKVLIYAQAKKAYLYDPVANKLLEIAPLNIGPTTASGQVAGEQTEKKATPTPTKAPKK